MWIVAEHRAQELENVAESRLLTERYLDGDTVSINHVDTSLVPCELNDHSGILAHPIKLCP